MRRPDGPALQLDAVVRKECVELWRDGRFRYAASLALVLLVASVAAGWVHHQRVETDRRHAQESVRRQWLEQGEKNPHSAAHFSVYAFRSPPPLASLDRGVLPFTGIGTWLEAHYRNEAVYRPARDQSALGRFGELTAAMTLTVLLPLLIIVLGFGAIAGERDAGTLALVASTGIPPGRFALGKTLGLTTALAALLVPAAALGAVALWMLADGPGRPLDGSRLLGLVAGHLLYLGAFVALVLAASAMAGSARAALGALVLFWAVSAFVAPRAVSDLAEWLYPTPSWHAFNTAVERGKSGGVDGHDPTSERTKALEREMLARYDVENVDELPIDFSGVALQVSEDHGNGVYDEHYESLWSQYERQHRLRLWASVVAPYLAIRDVSMAMAGTDWNHHRHFADAAETYRRQLVRSMNDELIYNSSEAAYESNLRGRDFWRTVPEFGYSAPGAGWALARSAGSFVVVLGFFLTAAAVLAARSRSSHARWT